MRLFVYTGMKVVRSSDRMRRQWAIAIATVVAGQIGLAMPEGRPAPHFAAMPANPPTYPKVSVGSEWAGVPQVPGAAGLRLAQMRGPDRGASREAPGFGARSSSNRVSGEGEIVILNRDADKPVSNPLPPDQPPNAVTESQPMPERALTPTPAAPSPTKGSGLLGRVRRALPGKPRTDQNSRGENLSAVGTAEPVEQSSIPATTQEKRMSGRTPTQRDIQDFAVSGEMQAGTPEIKAPSYPVLEQAVRKYRTPATSTIANPHDVCGALAVSSDRIRQAAARKDYALLDTETETIREQAGSLRALGTLPLEHRLCVVSICRMLDEGAELIEEGRATDDDSKIQMGLEKLHEAKQLLEKLPPVEH